MFWECGWGQSSAVLKGQGGTDSIITRFEVREFGRHHPDTVHQDVKLTKCNSQAGRSDLSSHLQHHLKPNTQVVLNTLKLSEEAQCFLPCSWDFSHAATSTWKIQNWATHLHTQESLYVENLPWSMPLTQYWIRCPFPCAPIGPTEIPPVLELYIL